MSKHKGNKKSILSYFYGPVYSWVPAGARYASYMTGWHARGRNNMGLDRLRATTPITVSLDW